LGVARPFLRVVDRSSATLLADLDTEIAAYRPVD